MKTTRAIYPHSASFALLVITLSLAACGPAMPPSAPHEFLGTEVEEADRPSLDGELATIPAPGKVTVLDFWSSYCAPCLESMPHLEALWKGSSEDGLVVVGICLDEDPFQTRDTLKSLGISFPQIIDDGHILSGRYRVTSIPAAFVFDKEGKLRFVALSDDYDHQEIVDAARFLLAE